MAARALVGTAAGPAVGSAYADQSLRDAEQIHGHAQGVWPNLQVGRSRAARPKRSQLIGYVGGAVLFHECGEVE